MMAEQIQAPTSNETGLPPSNNSSNMSRSKKVSGAFAPTIIGSTAEQLASIFKIPLSRIRSLFGKALNAIKPHNNPQLETNSMNYDKLKQKLFEAVSKEDMPCNKPRASTRPGKKKMVKACEGGKEKIVHFGDSSLPHNYSTKARKSFRARHKCGEKKSKLSAQYWACKNLWAGPKGSKKACTHSRCKY